MKSTKEMLLKSNAQVKKGATDALKQVNTNPTYLMRKLNKLAEGKDADYNDLYKNGLNKADVCEMYNRLQEAAGCNGFWWASIIAREGRCIVSARPVVFAEGDDNNDDARGMHCTSDSFVYTEVINGVTYSLKAASVWNYSNVIASASLFLKFKEEAAKESGNLYSWLTAQAEEKKKKEQEKEAEKEARKQARKQKQEQKKQERKQKKEQEKKVTETMKLLQEALLSGTITEEEAFTKFQKVIAA